jgi:hypothetical protein
MALAAPYSRSRGRTRLEVPTVNVRSIAARRLCNLLTQCAGPIKQIAVTEPAQGRGPRKTALQHV